MYKNQVLEICLAIIFRTPLGGKPDKMRNLRNVNIRSLDQTFDDDKNAAQG